MNAHIDDMLLDVALSSLDDEERAHIDSHLAQCARCAREVDRAREALALIPLVENQCVPSGSLRERILDSASGGRFGVYAARVAQLLDVAVQRARDMLSRIDDPTVWVPAPLPGVLLYHVEGGPGVAGAITGFVRIPAGAPFPTHEHLGDESVLVISGSMTHDDGTACGPGDMMHQPVGTEHAFVVGQDADLIYLTVLHGGLRIGDAIFPASDPRL